MTDKELLKEKQRLTKLTYSAKTMPELEETLRLLAILKEKFDSRKLVWVKGNHHKRSRVE